MSGPAIRRSGALVVVTALWLVVSAGGLLALWRYKARPAPRGAPPVTWPLAAPTHAADGPTLVMIAHPECPCTKASVAELGALLREAPAGVRTYVVASWDGELIDRARALAGVTVVVDAAAAAAFRVETSGHVLVYDAAGALRFSGGITGARGHVGDNVGRQRVLALLAGAASGADRSHVFGCALEAAP